MKKLLALTLALAMAISFAAAANAEGAKVLHFGEINPKVGYDPQTNTNSRATTIEECVVEGLYFWNDQNEEIPVLAEDFPAISEDGLVYTFTLRKGVYFSNGTELTTKDVKYTFERMFTPSTGALSTYMYNMILGAQEMLAGEATELAGFEIVDDYTFNITLTQPFSCFTKNLGIIYAAIFPADACEAAGSDWGIGTLIGTGPYVLGAHDNSSVTLTKNPNYWGSEPHFDEIIVTLYDDENTKLLAFENGDLDLCQVPTNLYLQYQGTETAEKFHLYYPLGTVFLSINLSEEYNGQPNPLSDVKVREAISMAIDRETLVEFIDNGLGTVATGTVNPYQLGFVERDPYVYDPDAAKALLAEAGYPNGVSFTAQIRSTDQPDMVQIQSDLALAGIDMKLELVDAATWTSLRNAGNAQCEWMGWFPLYADPDNNIYSYFHSTNAVGKSVFYNNPEFDALMDAARLSTDDAERAKLYEQADEIMSRQDYACIPLYYPNYVFAAQDYITNFTVGNLIYQICYDVDFDMDLYSAR